VFDSGTGWIGLMSQDGKLVRSTMPRHSYKEALGALYAGLGDVCVEDRSAFGNLPERLAQYFGGHRVDFDNVSIDVSAQPPFVASAQIAARSIHYGEVTTYKNLARIAGNAKAARAAGSAMARNQLPIIVPCHRIIASNGVGGFAFGTELKLQLLRLEGIDI